MRRAGCSNGERAPTGAIGEPGTLVGSSGTAGEATWAPARSAKARAPAAPTVPASRTRRLRRGPRPGFASRSLSPVMGLFLSSHAQHGPPTQLLEDDHLPM